MTITHHPDVSTLMSCAAGSQPEVFAAVVASHLALCPACAREAGKMQEIGVALFDALSPAALASGAPVVTARARNAVTGAQVCHPQGGDIPLPLKPLLGDCLSNIPWRRLSRSVRYYRVPMSQSARGKLYLFKAAPGTRLPEHRHRGAELTLVLKGSYRDKFGTFKAGDMADLDEGTEHEPIADEKDGCICLIAFERDVAYKGLLARLLQPLFGRF